jgi:hypothetical protein
MAYMGAFTKCDILLRDFSITILSYPIMARELWKIRTWRERSKTNPGNLTAGYAHSFPKFLKLSKVDSIPNSKGTWSFMSRTLLVESVC